MRRAWRHFGRARQVIDQGQVAQGRLGRLERRLLEDRGVERAPTSVLAVRNQTVSGPEHTPVRFGDREDWTTAQRGKPFRGGLLRGASGVLAMFMIIDSVM